MELCEQCENGADERCTTVECVNHSGPRVRSDLLTLACEYGAMMQEASGGTRYTVHGTFQWTYNGAWQDWTVSTYMATVRYVGDGHNGLASDISDAMGHGL